MTQPFAYDQPAPTSEDPVDNFRLQGEYLGDQLTPASARTDPSLEDLQQAAHSYANAAFGPDFTISALKQISDEPMTWQAQVNNGHQHSLLIAKRVVGGYDLYVEGVQGSTEGNVN